MTLNKKNKRPNIHVNYEKTHQIYHGVVASLVCQYIEPKNGKILDIGCGAGHTLLELSRLLPEGNFYAADIDKECVDRTRDKVFLKKGFVIKDILDINTIEQKHFYDAVVMSHVIEHHLRPADAVMHVMEIIRPGGILVLAVPNPVRPFVFYSAIRRHNYVNKGHVYAWDRPHYINFLENILKLHVIKYSQDVIEFPFLRGWKIFRNIGKKMTPYFPWLAHSNIAVIRKIH